MRALGFALYALLLAGCGLPGAIGGPPPTPTAPVDPYNAAVATAEAGGDPVPLAAAHFDRGNLLLDQGDTWGAIRDYNRALELDPANARAFHNRGLANAILGRVDRALADYNAALIRDPSYVRAYRNRLVLLEQQGDHAAVAADYGRLAELEPEAAGLYRYRQGAALARLREAGAARAAFDAALRADPREVDALYERALLSFAAGDLAAAIADLDAAIALSPQAANAFYARGLARSAAGDDERAFDDFSRAIELRPAGYPEALLARAGAYASAGQAELAAADLAALEGFSLDASLQRAAELLSEQLAAP